MARRGRAEQQARRAAGEQQRAKRSWGGGRRRQPALLPCHLQGRCGAPRDTTLLRRGPRRRPPKVGAALCHARRSIQYVILLSFSLPGAHAHVDTLGYLQFYMQLGAGTIASFAPKSGTPRRAVPLTLAATESKAPTRRLPLRSRITYLVYSSGFFFYLACFVKYKHSLSCLLPW